MHKNIGKDGLSFYGGTENNSIVGMNKEICKRFSFLRIIYAFGKKCNLYDRRLGNLILLCCIHCFKSARDMDCMRFLSLLTISGHRRRHLWKLYAFCLHPPCRLSYHNTTIAYYIFSSRYINFIQKALLIYQLILQYIISFIILKYCFFYNSRQIEIKVYLFSKKAFDYPCLDMILYFNYS